MQISLKWINELVDIEKLNLDDLVDKLTLGGFEVEEILELEINNTKEIVLDISATDQIVYLYKEFQQKLLHY